MNKKNVTGDEMNTKISFLITGLLMGVCLIMVCGAQSAEKHKTATGVEPKASGTYQMMLGPDFHPTIEGYNTCPYVINTSTGEVWSVSFWRDEVNNKGGYSWHCWGSPQSEQGYLGKLGDWPLDNLWAYQQNAKIYLRKTGVGQFNPEKENGK